MITLNNNEKLVNELIKRNWHIAFAESCTGGLCAATVVDVANASSILNESIVTYANSAKIKYLNVSEATIEKYNVVSEEVASEMALGIKKASNSEIGVGITGAAGPTSDGIIPVGRVCFGFSILDKVYTKTIEFGEIGRNIVRKKACDFVYEFILEVLKNEG